MLASTIQARPDHQPVAIDTDYAEIGDLLYNTETGQLAILDAILDDPFDFWNETPAKCAYVIGYKSPFSDYWHAGDVKVITRKHDLVY